MPHLPIIIQRVRIRNVVEEAAKSSLSHVVGQSRESIWTAKRLMNENQCGNQRVSNIRCRCVAHVGETYTSNDRDMRAAPSMSRNTPLSSPTSTNVVLGEVKSDTESETRLTTQRVPDSRAAFNFAAPYLPGISSTRATHLTHLTHKRASLARLPPSSARPHASSVVPEAGGVNSRSRTPTHEGKITVAGSLDTTRSHTIRPFPLPRRSPMSMCNNPYRHGWLPLLGLHNRALIDNLYGACRLFDYPPPAGWEAAQPRLTSFLRFARPVFRLPLSSSLLASYLFRSSRESRRRTDGGM